MDTSTAASMLTGRGTTSAGVLICHEAGAAVRDAADRDLIVIDHAARRTPVAGATVPLLQDLLDARRGWPISESSPAPPP